MSTGIPKIQVQPLVVQFSHTHGVGVGEIGEGGGGDGGAAATQLLKVGNPQAIHTMTKITTAATPKIMNHSFMFCHQNMLAKFFDLVRNESASSAN